MIPSFHGGEYKTWLSGMLCLVVRWMDTHISEAVLPPSPGMRFMIMEMYPLNCCLHGAVVDG